MGMACKKRIHASYHQKPDWNSINWKKVGTKVKKLQMRIAKAVRERRYRLAKSLQWLLTHSFYAKLLAVRRVVTNKGKRTPGVDGELWNTPHKKMRAVELLKRRGYKPLPLRRVYIQKKNGTRRPLSIPTIRDRAMQALHALALAPVAETTGDLNSYGFREYRSCADAIEQCFVCLGRRNSARWVLEADIKACFDRINHEWMQHHILMDRKILQAWLKAGYVEKGRLYPTKDGTPQGGVISPLLANMTLDGLESVIASAVPRGSKVNVIRYADDFVVTGESKEILREKVMPAIQGFLIQRGLNLSREKTNITRIEKGFDFLGQHLRKYKGKCIITPSKGAVKTLLVKTRKIIKNGLDHSLWATIEELNSVLRGWANYHRHICSKQTFSHVDNCIFKQLWKGVARKHGSKTKGWIRKRYFRSINSRNWCFFADRKTESGTKEVVDLFHATTTKIVRHIKIRSVANPYDKDWQDYLVARKVLKHSETVRA
jgi:RNA-directed DNA polymerase